LKSRLGFIIGRGGGRGRGREGREGRERRKLGERLD